MELSIPLVTQKLAYGLRESALKSTTAGFANAPVFNQYEGVCDRRFQGTLTQPIGQFLSHERYGVSSFQCLPEKRHYMADLLPLQQKMEDIAKRQLGLFRIESIQGTRTIEEIEERKEKTFNRSSQEASTRRSWNVLASVSKYIAATSGIIVGASAVGWPGMALAASGGIGLTAQLVQDTVGWKTLTSYLTKAEDLQKSWAAKIETGANYLSLGLGAAGGLGAYYTGAWAATRHAGQIISTSSSLSQAAAQFGSSYSHKKMSHLQADEKEMSAQITEKQQDLLEACKRVSSTLETTDIMADTLANIVAASEKEQII